MIGAIDHVNIVVSDLERSVHFYTQVLGFEEAQRVYMEGEWVESIVGLKGVRGHVVYVVAPGGGPRLELLYYESPRGEAIAANSLANTQGLRHLALRVDDIEASVKKLEAAGVEMVGPPVVVPAHVVEHAAGQKVLCYFYDPDGVLLEITEYR